MLHVRSQTRANQQWLFTIQVKLHRALVLGAWIAFILQMQVRDSLNDWANRVVPDWATVLRVVSADD